MFGWFACCTAAPAADSFVSPADKDVEVPPHVSSQPQKQVHHKAGWKHWSQQGADQLKLAAEAAGATPQKPGRVSLRQRRRQHFSEPEDAAAGDVAAANPPILSSSVPLTSRSLIAAATGCHSLSASASVQAYQRTGGAIRHQDTGDSPSEIHSELVQQQPKVLSSCSTSCERTGGQPAGSVQSITSADNKQQQLLQVQDEPPEQAAVPTIRVQTAQSSLSSMLLLESHHHQQQQFAFSNSCHATASSAGTAVLPVEAAVPLCEAAALPMDAAVLPCEAAVLPVEAAVLPSERAVQLLAAAEAGTTARQETSVTQPTTTRGTEGAAAEPAGTQLGTHQQQGGIDRTNTISSGESGSLLPPHIHLYRLESGTSFQMADPQLSSSSSNIVRTTSSTMGTSVAHVPLAGGVSGSLATTFSFPPSPATAQPAAASLSGTPTPNPPPQGADSSAAAAAAAGAAAAAAATRVNQGSFVQLTGSAKSPFAQLTLQQSVASALLSNQPQQQQIQQRYSLPLMQQPFSSAQSFISAPNAPAPAAAAAVGRASSSGSLCSNSAAAMAGAVMPLTPNSVTPRTTRISWAAPSVAPAPESTVFDVLDPETASTDSGLRILRQSASSNSLKRSASSTSLSSLTAGLASGFNSSFSSRTAKGKLHQLRAAVSMSWDHSGEATAAPAAAAVPGARPGLKSILRRSTESLIASASVKSTASAFRRSKSAHSNVMQQHSVAMESAAGDAGYNCDQASPPAAALTASSSSADLRRSLPPLPPAASSSGTLVGTNSAPVALGRTYTSAAVAGSVSSFATSGSMTRAGAGSGLPSFSSSSSSSNRVLSNVTAVSTLEHQSSASSGVASAGSMVQVGRSSSSLVALAVNRMHSVTSSSNLGGPQSSTGSASSTAGSTTDGTGLNSQGSTSALSTMSSNAGSTSSLAAQGSTGSTVTAAGVCISSSSSSVQVATAFAEAFLAALASGNTRWGSDVVVSKLLHETAKMLGIDKQLYSGKTAIIRRLNSGMDQLVKMVAANAPDGSTPAGSTAAVADLASSMPKPVVSISCPDPKSKPSLAVAKYTFKWGVRKFTLKDEFIVKQGQIMRLRRSRG